MNSEFTIAADLRIGGGTDTPADGFSFSFARPDDPFLASGNTAADFAGPVEEGTRTGLSIGIDEYYNGVLPDGEGWVNGGVEDVIGISIRIDGTLRFPEGLCGPV